MGNKLTLFNLRHKRYKGLWYADKHQYSENLLKDYKIRKFILDEARKMRFDVSDVVIYGSNNLKIDLHTAKPGLVLGKNGANINEFKLRIAEIAKVDPKELNINLVPVNKPEINAELIALKIALDLEKRRSYNQVMRTHAEDAMRFGAIGIRVQCAGRLNGVEIARAAAFCRGTVPRNTIRANVYYAQATAYTKCGTCGVKVWLNVNQNPKKRFSQNPKPALAEKQEVNNTKEVQL